MIVDPRGRPAPVVTPQGRKIDFAKVVCLEDLREIVENMHLNLGIQYFEGDNGEMEKFLEDKKREEPLESK